MSADGPRPSRWILRTIRVTFAEFADYTLSGVWRALTRLDLRLRSARGTVLEHLVVITPAVARRRLGLS